MKVKRIGKKHAAYLAELEKRGRLTPEMVLADAKNPKSPLHELYNWDVRQAAEQYWIERSREIIRTIKVIVKTETTTISYPKYVRDPDMKTDEQGYISIDTLVTDKRASKRVILMETERILSCLDRARSVAEALNLMNHYHAVLEKVTGLREAVEV